MNALVFIAHGSRREESNTEFEQMVLQFKKIHESRYTRIEACFLEFARPSINHVLNAMIHEGISTIEVYPFFLNSGKHVRHDIPEEINNIKIQNPEIKIKLLSHFGSSEYILSVIDKDLKGT